MNRQSKKNKKSALDQALLEPRNRERIKTGAVWFAGVLITLGLSQVGAPTWLVFICGGFSLVVGMSFDWVWETTRRRVVLGGLVFMLLASSAFFLFRSTPQPFTIFIHNALAGINCKEHGVASGFWIARTMITQTTRWTELVPINAALFVGITNLQDKPITIRKVAIEPMNATGDWEKLKLVLSTTGTVYFSGIGVISGSNRAQRITEPFMDVVVRNALTPGAEVRGWVFLQYSETFKAPVGRKKQFRISLLDAGGNTITASIIGVTLSNEDDVLPASHVRIGKTDDFIYPMRLPLDQEKGTGPRKGDRLLFR